MKQVRPLRPAVERRRRRRPPRDSCPFATRFLLTQVPLARHPTKRETLMSHLSYAQFIDLVVVVASRAARLRSMKILVVVFVTGSLMTLFMFGQALSSNYSSSPLPGIFNSPAPTPPAPDPATSAILNRTTKPIPGKIITASITAVPPTPSKLAASLSYKMYLPVVQEAAWSRPGFGGGPSASLVSGIDDYLWYGWGPSCDYPDNHQVW